MRRGRERLGERLCAGQTCQLHQLSSQLRMYVLNGQKTHLVQREGAGSRHELLIDLVLVSHVLKTREGGLSYLLSQLLANVADRHDACLCAVLQEVIEVVMRRAAADYSRMTSPHFWTFAVGTPDRRR